MLVAVVAFCTCLYLRRGRGFPEIRQIFCLLVWHDDCEGNIWRQALEGNKAQ